MKVFHCDHCAHLLFFENTGCVQCGHQVAYLPDLDDMGSLEPIGDGRWRSPLPAARDRSYRLCRNYVEMDVCNWAISSDDPNPLCVSCRLTRLIPDVSQTATRLAWYRLEVAKRRLVFTLKELGLPLGPGAHTDDPGLAFEFKADSNDPSAPRVMTGHSAGVITVNIAEADDAERERRRAAVHEPYRTLLGHMRHESGHYYWGRLIKEQASVDVFSSALRRRAGRLRRVAPHPLRAGAARRLAHALRQQLREQPSLGGLGRDLGPLPAHVRHAGDRGGLRPLPEAPAHR